MKKYNVVTHESVTNLPGISVHLENIKNNKEHSVIENNDRLIKRFLKKVKGSDIVKEFISTLRYNKPSEIKHLAERRVKFIQKKIAQYQEKERFSQKNNIKNENF